METKIYCDVCLRTDKYCVDYYAVYQQITITTNRFKIVLPRTTLDKIYNTDFIKELSDAAFDVETINNYINSHIKDIIKAGRDYKIVRVIALKENEFNVDEPVIITDNIDNHVVCPLQTVINYITINFEDGKNIYNLSQYEIMEVMQAVKRLYAGEYDTVQ